MDGWTRSNLRHLAMLFHRGSAPARTLYESIGDDFFLAPAPGWLNLGWWNGEGDASEVAQAPPRLVERIAAPLPRDASILDVANGLGAQDEVIRRVAHPKRLVAVNITEFQLRAGLGAMRAAQALPVCADAMRLPVAGASMDGVISVEAAFHFPSRARFFAEARRVLRPGGVLTMSDVSVEGRPRSAATLFAGLAQMRFWGLRRDALQSAGRIVALAESAGFTDVRAELCAQRTIDPALRWVRERLARAHEAPRSQRWAAGVGLRQVERLREAGLLQYVLLTARAR